MALELDSITFAVNTDALKEAVTAVDKLKVAVQDLSKANNISNEAAKAVNEIAKQQKKEAKEAAKALKEQGEAAEESAPKMDKVTRALEHQALKMKVLRGDTIQFSDSLVELERVYTSGQASQLASLKLNGASAEQFKKMADAFYMLRQESGANSLDMATGNLEILRKKIFELSSVNELMAQNLGLSRQQIVGLARDLQSIRNTALTSGMDPDSELIQQRINKRKEDFVLESKRLNQLEMYAAEADKVAKNKAKADQDEQAMFRMMREQEWSSWAKSIDAEEKAINQRSKQWAKYYADQEKSVQALERQRMKSLGQSPTGSSKPGEQAMDAAVSAYAKQQNNAAKATAWLEREITRADNALGGLNNNLAVSSSNRILKFKEMLAASGVEATEAANRLKRYSEVIELTEKKNTDKKKNDREAELRYLARATSVQMGDVAVSLAGGMNPLTIMMQQGDQLRGIFAQVGANSKEMEKAMGQAFGQIIGGFVDVSKAMGQFVLGSIKSTGEAMMNFATKPVDMLVKSLFGIDAASKAAGAGVTGFTAIVRTASAVVMGTALFAAVAALIALGVSLKETIKQENELTRAFTMNAGALGLSIDAANNYAQEIGKVNGNTSLAMQAITAMGKEGNIAADKISTVTESAIELNKAMGIPIEETVKQFSKLSDAPSKTIIELAKATGLIDIETVKLVMQYEEVGNKAKAASLATEAYANATKTAADTVRENYGYFTTFFMGISDVAKQMWDNISGYGRKGTIQQSIAATAAEISKVRDSDVGIFQTQESKDHTLKMLNMQLQGLQEKLALEQSVADTKQKQSKAAGLIESFEKETEKVASNREKREKETLAFQNKYYAAALSGELSMEKYQQGLRNIAAKYKDTKEPKTDAEKEIDKFNRLKDSLMGRSAGLSATFIGDVAMINKLTSGKEREDLLARLVKLQPLYTEQIKAELDAQIKLQKVWDESIKKQSKQDELDIAALIKSDELTTALNEEVDMMKLKMSLTGLSNEAQKRAIETKKIEIELAKELATIEKDSAGDKAERLLAARGRAVAKQQMLELGLDYDKLLEVDKLQKSVGDAFITALTDGGKAGSKKLRSIITAELMKPITIYVNAVVNSLMSSLGISPTQMLASGSNNPMGVLGSNMGSSILGTAGLYAGGMGIGSSIGKSISNGYGSNSTVNAGTILGSIFAGPIGGAIGGAIGGVVNRLFGSKVTEQGIQGSYGTNGFTGSSYTFKKGGLFRSNSTSYGDLDPMTKRQLDASYSAIDGSMKYIASQFKTTMTGTFSEIKVNLMGLSASDAQAKLAEAIASSTKQALDSIALPEWAADVVKALGDTFSMDALTSALGGISAMKTALDALGYSSQAWADITSGSVNELIAEFGTIQVAQQNMSSYYQAYYSEQEQLAFAMSDLNNQLKALGVTAPATTEAYRALVDDALVQGNDKLAASLIKLAPTFKQVMTSLDNLTSALTTEITRLQTNISTSTTNTSSSLYTSYAQFVKQQELAASGNQEAIQLLPELSKSIEEQSTKYARTSADVVKVQSWLVEGLSRTVDTVNANAKMESLLAEVSAKIETLSAEAKANAASAAKTARILERVTPDGQSLSVVVVA